MAIADIPSFHFAHGSPLQARTTSANKRQIILSDEEGSASEDDYSPPVKKAKASTKAVASSKSKGKGKAKQARDDSDFSMEEGSSDDFDDGGIDWEAAADLSDVAPSSTTKPVKSVKSVSKQSAKSASKQSSLVDAKPRSDSVRNRFLSLVEAHAAD